MMRALFQAVRAYAHAAQASRVLSLCARSAQCTCVVLRCARCTRTARGSQSSRCSLRATAVESVQRCVCSCEERPCAACDELSCNTLRQKCARNAHWLAALCSDIASDVLCVCMQLWQPATVRREDDRAYGRSGRQCVLRVARAFYAFHFAQACVWRRANAFAVEKCVHDCDI